MVSAGDDLDMNVYPTVAISDGVMAVATWTASNESFRKGRTDVAFGLGIVALASTAGALRFGFAPKVFAGLNNVLAAYAGRVGMPLVCVGFAASRGALPDILPSSFPFTILLVLVLAAFFSRTYFSFNLQELYTTIVNVVALNLLLYAEEYLRNPMAVVAVLLYVFAGLLVGSDRHRYILGVRRENIFHYLLAISMLLFGKALLNDDGVVMLS